jgi:hypothetical protein
MLRKPNVYFLYRCSVYGASRMKLPSPALTLFVELETWRPINVLLGRLALTALARLLISPMHEEKGASLSVISKIARKKRQLRKSKLRSGNHPLDVGARVQARQ